MSVGLTKLSETLYQLTNRTTFGLAALTFCLFVFWIMPNAEDAGRIVSQGGSSRSMGLLSYTADDFYTQLESFGVQGRAAFVDYRMVTDLVWLLTLGVFFTTAIGLVLQNATPPGCRKRLLNLAGVLPALLDLIENSLQIGLVQAYPTRYDGLATLAAVVTTLKWFSLLLALMVLFYGLLRWALGGRRLRSLL